ncbi:hypothetical protein [Hymenobacter bucti]|uniref:Uncharacterized protein n=1 Tax=Hymenobacter bucti TaxID=1844114 RepID=A0ABW4QXJ3_9BACT
MLNPEEFEAALDHYLASDAQLGPPQIELIKRWSEQVGHQDLPPLSEVELAETRRKMWARIQALTAASDEPPAAS